MANAQDLINQWIPRHGQIVGQPYVVNPTSKDADGYTVPTGDPVYRYSFADGSYLETDSSGAIKTAHEVTPTARSTTPTAVSAPPTEQYLLVRDPQTGALSSQSNPNYRPPSTGAAPRTTVQNSSGVYERQDDGTYKLVLAADKAPRIVGGTSSADKQLIVEDAAGNRSYIANPNYQAPRPQQLGTNATDRYIVQSNPDGTTNQIENPNYQAPRPVLAAGGTPADQYIVTMAPDGTLTSQKNPNYTAGKPTMESGFANASQIPMIVKDPDGNWTVQWTENKGQATTPVAALTDLGKTLGLNLGDGSGQIPVDTATKLFDTAHQAYSDQTSRQQANNQGAQIGAGLLQNRASNVNSQENTLLSLAGNKSFGLGGPLPPGLWAGVHNEVMNNATQAGGGQSTYDTAVALVHQAAPQIAGTPAAAAHVAVVQQMLQAQQQPAQPAAPPAAPPAPVAAFQAPTMFTQSGIAEGSNRTVDPASVVHAAVSAALQPGDYTQSGIAEGSNRNGFQAPTMRVM